MTANCGKVSIMFPDHFVNYVPDRSAIRAPRRQRTRNQPNRNDD
jgi:hypothetical protein